MSKKILITGATGFIGSYLVKFFTKEGYKVVAHGSSETTINNLIKALSIFSDCSLAGTPRVQ